MTTDQIILFSLLALVFGFLIWGRWRYDLVALSALLIAVISGVVPVDNAFSGFGHPATIVIALVLIVSRGLSNSGVVELIADKLMSSVSNLFSHIALLSGVAAALSAIMNNVAALALLMPVDLQAASRNKRSPALTLMPLSFASILGGLVTMIGTPPNIIIATFRGDALGEPFGMFDFTPVGIVAASVGVVFITLIGWRLIPKARTETDTTKELFNLEDYVAELKVGENAKSIGKTLGELDAPFEEVEAQLIGLIRGSNRFSRLAHRVVLEEGDLLVVQASPESIERLAGTLGLDFVDMEQGPGVLEGGDLALAEMVVPRGAHIEGRSAISLQLLSRHGVTLLGVSRQGARFRDRVRQLRIEAGDILLLIGGTRALGHAMNWLGGLPLATRGAQIVKREKAWLAMGIFLAAIILASVGLVYLPIAIAVVVVFYALFDIVPTRDLYNSVEWPVIVLLGAMIPIGQALETSGGTGLIASGIVSLSEGYSALIVLTLLMIITMTLSDVMNNTATAVIAAPIAVDIAQRLNANPDPFLMAVAVAASCAFLTPIGHKNNMLIMGPGGYRFGDYWRMGLPLEILVIAVSIPMIVWVWPL